MENISIGGTDKDWENYYILCRLEESEKELIKTINLSESQDKESNKAARCPVCGSIIQPS